MNYECIAGVDEAGRGALAGPVVAACCCLPIGAELPEYIVDSKVLSPSKRQIAFEWIKEHCVFGIGKASANYIDTHGIKKATHKAMKQAIVHICKQHTVTELYIDGNDAFTFNVAHQSFIRGDSLHPCISAASIVAKVTRDAELVRVDAKYTPYGFAKHKGYGTAVHRAMLQQHGFSAYHRQTFVHV